MRNVYTTISTRQVTFKISNVTLPQQYIYEYSIHDDYIFIRLTVNIL